MPNYELVIEHHGTKGQRWGIRNAEFYPISAWKAHLAREGHNKKSSLSIGERIKKKKAIKKRNETLAKARAAKAKAEASRKEREEIIKTGDIDKALKRIDDFSNEELTAITERNKAKIAVSQAKTDRIVSNLGTMQDVTNKMSNIANNSINIYNSIAKVANTFGDKNMKMITVQQNNNQNNNQNNQKKK